MTCQTSSEERGVGELGVLLPELQLRPSGVWGAERRQRSAVSGERLVHHIAVELMGKGRWREGLQKKCSAFQQKKCQTIKEQAKNGGKPEQVLQNQKQ